jgi:putative ABC transport system permease protein
MNYLTLKTIIRLFQKNKLIFSLCILGLSVGFAVFITVITYVSFEYSYDKDHKNANNIYRMHPIYGQEDGYINTYATSDCGYGPSLKEDLPEVIDYVRMIAYQSERVITYSPENKNERQYREPHVFMVDSNFFSFFDYQLKVGSPNNVLINPGTIVISESAVRKYFGNENPVGKKLMVSDYGQPFTCEVTGVFYDLPANSNLQFNFLISLETWKQGWPQIDNSWNYGISYTYLHLAENTDIEKFDDEIMRVFKARSGFVIPENLKFEMELAHFPAIHLDDPVQWELEKKGKRAETKYLLVIALVIIVVSWLNYTNITTSLVNQRANNSRIKMILGSGKSQLVLQFIIEAFFVNLVSLCVGILFIVLGQNLISLFFGANVYGFIINNSFTSVLLISILVFGTLATGVLSAIVFFISNPDFLLYPKARNPKSTFRRVMVVTQFATGIVLLIGTMVVFKQVRFLKSQGLGVNLDHILVIKAPPGGDAHTAGIEKFRLCTANIVGVEQVSAGSDIPGQFMDMGYLVNRTNVNPPVHAVTDGGRIDHEYVETLGLQVVAGKDFSEGMNTEKRVLINEKMVELLKFEDNDDAVGKQIMLP